MNEVKNLFVSSRNRDIISYPNGNNYVLHLTTPVRDVHRVELLTCSVPNTLYNITDGENIIKIISNSGEYTFTIPSGFYSGSGLANEVRAAIYPLTKIEVIYKGNEGKFFFRSELEFTYVRFKSLDIAKIFGFDTQELNAPSSIIFVDNSTLPLPPANINLYNWNENLPPGSPGCTHNWYYMKSTTIANLNPNDGIFLDISELRTPFNEDCKKSESVNNFYSGQNVSRIFGLIPMDVSSGAIKNFKKETDYNIMTSYPNPIASIDRLTIQWLNKDGIRVNFNGADDNSFILRFHTLRRSL